ncbi:MAG: DNA-directed RNA polymerase subunit alpha [Planctomycetes bacterium]|nr:DNA-directed RNA polymerase subunit alpha [Planctomycetota bacterium]
MRIRWRGLELPSRVVLDDSVSNATYGRFVIEPFERGFGTTIGNSLRRILLSSLEGSAVVSVKIGTGEHEFTTLPGVLEDLTDIVLNVKNLIVHLEGDEPKSMHVSRRTKGEIRGCDIEADASIRIVNPDQLIATLTDDVTFEMEMSVGKGRGYQPATEPRGPEQEIGVIAIDAIYSPVLRVRYRTEDTRVGQRTNYDRLILEIWTRGTAAPDDALVEAARILRKHLNPFVEHAELGDDMLGESIKSMPDEVINDDQLQDRLNQPISVLELSVRSANCLEGARISTVGDLARMTEAELLRLRSFGKTSLREIQRKLNNMGLWLGIRTGAPAEPSADPLGDPPGEATADSTSKESMESAIGPNLI